MSKQQRTGMKRSRSERLRRRFELGNYRIVTDTEETEKLYFEGLRDSLSPDLREKIEILVEKKVSTKDLVKRASEIISHDFRETWIVFDRDRVKNFDEIIKEADEKNINIAWSNPCIEIWFLAYYNYMSDGMDSVQCCAKFGEVFKNKTGNKYNKNDKEIYKKLSETGDEDKAIKIAATRYNDWIRQKQEVDPSLRPSKMNACTLMFTLVGEIRSKSIKHPKE